MNTTINTTSRSRRRFTPAIAIAVVGLAMTACGSDDEASSNSTADTAAVAAEGAVTIADPWSRQPAEGQTTTAVYGVVTNHTDQDITAIAASTPVTETVELHQVTMNDDGQMSMSEKEGGYVIAAGESLTFEPGGAHIMMLGIDAATYPANVDVTLEFDSGATIDFSAEVREIGPDEMDMDETEG